MNRRTTKKNIVTLLEKIRKKIPGVSIRTSLIVGFPSEREEEFKELIKFVNEMQLEHVGVFTFSREEGTPAYDLPGQVHLRRRNRRQRELMEMQQQVSKKLNQKHLGRKMDVLIDEKQKEHYIGRTPYQCFDVDGVVYVHNRKVKVGEIFPLEIVDAYEYDLVAR